ncbi:hypothetical protein X801_04309, partial [Opisthorchis viverrini]
TLLNSDAPGLGAALVLPHGRPAFLLGTLTHLQSFLTPSLHEELRRMVEETPQDHRDTILRDNVVYLPIPRAWSVRSPCLSAEILRVQDASDSLMDFSKRPFKPLFYTDTSLYLTAMPNGDTPSPGDGLILCLVKLGLLLVHVASNFPPTASLFAVSQFVESSL